MTLTPGLTGAVEPFLGVQANFRVIETSPQTHFQKS
jgi:hypothetical protein